MKKFLIAFIALVYLAISSGFVLNVHYCMGKISGVNIDNFNPGICRCSKSQKQNACCSSKFKVVKLNQAHKAPVATIVLNAPAAMPMHFSFITSPQNFSIRVIDVALFVPPDDPNNIYIRNCVFRV